jgi:DNA primase
MTAIDEIKARIDIVDIVSENVQLRRSGKNFTGFCPFHANTRTPAFVVFPETGTWRCFGECNDGGDIFKFIMKKEGWDFPEALRELALRAGVVLTPQSPEQQVQYEEYDRLQSLLEDVVTFYNHNLKNTIRGESALKYLRSRGLSDQSIEAFGLGYAPKSWEATINYLKSKGYIERELIDAGMVSQNDSGGIYDRFRHRAMIPIRDYRGRMVAFGARVLDPEDIPKYLNSPQTDIFDKGRILFGMDKARREIRSRDQVVIVEGYMGVIAPHQHGYTNVVATMGTALTENHLRMIKRFTRNIVLAMDSDTAGMKATLRGLEVARSTLERQAEVQFDARGLMHQEARLQADIRVTTLPNGMDPDDVVLEDPKAWERLVSAAKPIVVHVMETLAENRDLEDPKTKSEIARQVMPLIADVPSSIERDAYRQRLARLLKVDERSLASPPGGSRTRPFNFRRSKQTQTPTGPASIVDKTTISSDYRRETHILGILLRFPELIYRIDRCLKEQGLETFSAFDFQHTDHQLIYRLIHQSLQQAESEPLHYVLNHLPEEIMSTADQVLSQTETIDPQNERVLEDILRIVIMTRLRSVNQQLDYLRYSQEDIQSQGDLKASQYQSTMGRYQKLLGRLHKAQYRYTNRSLSTK